MISDRKVSIIIPNWNGSKLLKKHFPSVIEAARSSELIVVDDASSDDSVRFLKTNYPKVLIILKRHHEGFSSCINLGVREAKGDIVVLLNTDVEPQKNFLNYLTPHFIDDRVFAVGCLERSIESGKIVLRGRGQAAWEKGFYIHWKGEINKIDTAWVSGGSSAFKKEIWLKLGGMDTLFNPFYWEDIDLSYRALKAGNKLLFEPKSIVNHFHEEGMIKQKYSQKEITQVAYRNQFIFIWKNISDPYFFCEHLMWVPIRLIQALGRGDNAMIIGFILALIQIPKIVVMRMKYNIPQKRSDRSLLINHDISTDRKVSSPDIV